MIDQSTLTCASVENSTQCNTGLGETTLNGNCFWLFSDDDTEVDAGMCQTKTNNSIECGDAKRSSQCTMDGVTKLGTNCFWLYSSSDGEEGNCKAKNDDELSCSNVKRSSQCPLNDVDKLDSKCIWISGESTECQEIKSTCSSVITQPTCETPGASSTGSCVWVLEETTKCQEVKTSCNNIESLYICETPGAAKSGTNSLSCIWISEEPDTSVKKCQEVQISCEIVNREASCKHSGAAASGTTPYTCVWVTSSEQNDECKTQQAICSSISEKNMCLTTGSAKEGSCFWLKERTNSSGTGDDNGAARCILKVCYLYFYY
jgi:hypothetical protein